MASLTPDDSLVFADEYRGVPRSGPRNLPNTSNFSPDSKSDEPTQLDQSTSPVFRDHSFSLSDDHELAPLAFGDPQSTGESGSRSDEMSMDVDVDMGADTQLIQSAHEKTGPQKRFPDDTQVIGSGDGSDFRREKGTSALNLPVMDEHSSETAKTVETQPLASNGATDETQVIGIAKQHSRNDLRPLNLDTQVIGETTTHDIGGDDEQNGEAPIQLNGIADNLDTQVIRSAPLLPDTQVISVALPHLTDETQVIANRQLEDMDNIGPDQNSSPKKSPTLLWRDTQPITQLDVHLPPEDISLTKVISSPNKEMETTLIFSPSHPGDEPTTQVPNTQEETIYDKHASVDLGHKPVFSSGQNDEKLRSDLSIISNDDDLRVDEINVLYEDSVFRHKRKRIRLSSSQELEESQLSENLEQEDLAMEVENDETLHDETLHDETSQKVNHDQNETTQVSEDKVGLTLVRNAIVTQNSLGRSSPKPEIDIDEPKVALKTAWSQSSSELEDVSHDVNDLDLNALTAANMDDFDEVSDNQIFVPTKRRRNQIPGTQSQNEKPELRDQDPIALNVQCIVNPNAVWAFSLFKHYPARVLESGEVTSFIEFADTAQIEVKNTDLFLLDLRLGDTVHIILSSGEYLVTGLTEYNSGSEFKCMRGYDTAWVSKKGRNNAVLGKEIQVPISQLFMEVGEWASHQQKNHIFHDDIDLVQENFGVVRNILRALNYVDEEKQSDVQVSPKKLTKDTSGKSLKSNLFEGIVFFVTSIEGARKEQLSEMITTNGGVLIDEEIKQYTTRETQTDGGLLLSLSNFKEFRFGALLSDGYSRSAKYLQALALGWPILSECYVEHTIQNPEMLDHWQVYLLPAGHLLFTNGVRSMDVSDFRNNCIKEVSMNDQLENNVHLLSLIDIFVLNKKQDSKTLDMCGFIFHAFGAKSLSFCLSVSDINSRLRGKVLKNVLIYDNGAKEYLSFHQKKTVRKSQKANSKGTVGIIDWEWVVQCVISGYVWNPPSSISL